MKGLGSPTSNLQHPTGRWLWIFIIVGSASRLRKLTAAEENDIPPLLPPHPVIPPTFWEQNGGWVLLGIAALLAVTFTIVLLVRKRERPPPPIEVLIRNELERLRRVPPDGRVLSQVSRCVRRYFAVAFELPREELTTREFVQTAHASSSIGAELAGDLSEFLRQCDEAKFSPEPPRGTSIHVEAASRAIGLLERGEARRAELRRASDAPAPASQNA